MTTSTVVRGAPASAPPDPSASFDQQAVDAGRERWARTTAAERSALLERVIDDTLAAAADWVADAAAAKGIAPGTPPVGEEWHSGPALVARSARLLRDSLRDIERGGRPSLPGALRDGPGGRVIAPVFPAS